MSSVYFLAAKLQHSCGLTRM